MRINGNKIVTGMFVFDQASEYTPNDFIIKSGVIYVCNKEVSGEDPETSDSFTIYLGEQSASISECLEFLETGEGSNKYLSIGVLQAILSAYLTGPTGKGIIGDYIYYSPETYQVCIKGALKTTDEYYSDPESILSQIMSHPDINHGMFRVSRLLPEIYGYVGDPSLSQFSEEDSKSCILRQYTYLQEESGDTIRIQELIDHIAGLIWYRSLNLSADRGAASGVWKCSVVNSAALKEKAEAILGLYTSRLKVLRSLESHLKSNFRYRKFDLPSGKVTAVNMTENSEISILISEKQPSGLIKNYPVSLILGSAKKYYVVGDNLRLKTDGGLIQLETISGGDPDNNSWISDVYYKEYYGAS